MNQLSRPPLVAVTGPVKRLRVGWWATRLQLRMCGLRACYLTSQQATHHDPIHGVVIGGGDDIEPQHYGVTGDAGAEYDPERDRFEMDIVRRALAANIPVFGICRGVQLINVVLKGNLYADIRPMRRRTPRRNSVIPIKWVDLVGPSLLRQSLGVEKIKVNQLHNQAIDKIGTGLNVTARDRDGFIQAVESEQGFLLGVQWHPEYLPYLRSQRLLFKYFARAVHAVGSHMSLAE